MRWLASGLGPGQNADKVLRFLGPPSPDLAGQHNQPGPPPIATRELQVGPFFAPGCHQRCAVLVGTPAAWGAHLESRRRRVVSTANCSRQPVSNNFQSPIVESVGSSQVHVLNPHVQRHPCANFPADTGRNPVVQRPLLSRKLLSGGHEGRVANHRQSLSEGGIGNQKRRNS